MTNPNPVERNREHLTRVKVDDLFLSQHWHSLRMLVSYIPPGARSFLDMGCGPHADISDLIPEMDYTGIDIVPEYTEQLAGRIGPSKFGRARTFRVASMDEPLPFAPESFDVVCTRHTLEHVSRLSFALGEARRVLRPGGRLLFCVPAFPGDTEPAHLTRWSADQWREAISRVARIETSGQRDFFLNEFYGYGVR